jgi:hypothetical protein
LGNAGARNQMYRIDSQIARASSNAVDEETYGFFLASSAYGGACSFVKGLPAPINPDGSGHSDFELWWNFSFTSPIPITPDSDLFLSVVVCNFPYTLTNPTALRVEFFHTSAFY